MIAVLLTTLFTASAFLAIAAMAASWRRYGRQAMTMRAQLAACKEWRDVHVRLSEVTARQTATILRPAFTGSKQTRSGLRSRALPAAA